MQRLKPFRSSRKIQTFIKVEVRATLNKETSKPGYYFALDARVTIAGMTVAQAEKLLKKRISVVQFRNFFNNHQR